MEKTNNYQNVFTTKIASCTPHPGQSCSPACRGGGHCVPNVTSARRPTRQDMIDWLESTIIAGSGNFA